jgi:hypothetical protein
MLKLMVILVFLISFVTACSSGPSRRWVKDGVSEEQFKQDEFDCDWKATTMNQRERDDIIRAIGNAQDFKKCMYSKGYRWEKIN